MLQEETSYLSEQYVISCLCLLNESLFLPVYAQGNIGKWFDLARLIKGLGTGLSWQRACIVPSLSGAGVDTEHLVLLHLSAIEKSSRTL